MWVLLGIPDRRDVYPTGYSFYEPPVEVWHYGFFIIIFVDYHRENIYRLEPSSAWQISQIQNAQVMLNQGEPLAGTFRADNKRFDFKLQAKTEEDVTTFVFMIPVKTISFSQNVETKSGEAVLHVQVIIRDAKSNNVVESQTKDFPLSLTQEQVSKLPETLVLQMAFTLKKGEYMTEVTIQNNVDQAKAQKQAKFKI